MTVLYSMKLEDVLLDNNRPRVPGQSLLLLDKFAWEFPAIEIKLVKRNGKASKLEKKK